MSPKTDLNLSAICGVIDISGSKTTTDFPNFIAFFEASINTSVLPLPVTPCSKNGSN